MALIRITIERASDRTDAPRPRRRRTAAVIVASSLVVGGAMAGLTAATAQTPKVVSPGGPYRYLGTPFKLFTNHSFAAGSSYSVVGIGGATTVPTNANSILIHVTTKAALSGSLTITPAGLNPDGFGQTLSWPVGVPGVGDFALSIGTKSQITFTDGARAVSASATILGYSEQSTASDISDDGAKFGQVLTSSGGLGTAWADPGGAGDSVDSTDFIYARSTGTLIASTPVGPGSHFVMFTGTVYGANSVTDNIDCYVNAGSTTVAAQHVFVVDAGDMTFTLQGMYTSDVSLTVSAYCSSSSNNALIDKYAVLSAIQLSSASGNNAH